MADAISEYRGEAGRALAVRTIEHLCTHNIPITAANYEVWLAHAVGQNPHLSAEIQQVIDRCQPFTDDVSADLHAKYFANAKLPDQVVEASEGIARELAEVVSSLREAGLQSGAFAGALQDTIVNLEQDPSNIRSAIAHLAASTREMAANNRRLSEQMAASSNQVQALQDTLHSVKIEAMTDALTGLANRRLFDESLSKNIRDAEADGTPLCLVLCDIDHFKHFNDTWGHLFGDQVIRFIANVLRAHTEEGALAARYGGEEFALVLPGTELAEAHHLASKIHEAIRSKRLTRKATGEALGKVTISIGIAKLRPGESASSLISRADACLYASKRAGRDRITADAGVAGAARSFNAG